MTSYKLTTCTTRTPQRQENTQVLRNDKRKIYLAILFLSGNHHSESFTIANTSWLTATGHVCIYFPFVIPKHLSSPHFCLALVGLVFFMLCMLSDYGDTIIIRYLIDIFHRLRIAVIKAYSTIETKEAVRIGHSGVLFLY
jgi:hypothetical protein